MKNDCKPCPKSARTRLYEDIACRLLAAGRVKYVDLYNNQWAQLWFDAALR